MLSQAGCAEKIREKKKILDLRIYCMSLHTLRVTMYVESRYNAIWLVAVALNTGLAAK